MEVALLGLRRHCQGKWMLMDAGFFGLLEVGAGRRSSSSARCFTMLVCCKEALCLEYQVYPAREQP